MLAIKSILKKISLEAIIWSSALVYLALIDPDGQSISFCPLDNLGFTFCPGCGLGRSMAYLFDGELIKSFQTHPLGIVASLIISFRIIQLSLLSFKRIKNNKL